MGYDRGLQCCLTHIFQQMGNGNTDDDDEKSCHLFTFNSAGSTRIDGYWGVTSHYFRFFVLVDCWDRQAATIIDSGTAEHSKVVGIV